MFGPGAGTFNTGRCGDRTMFSEVQVRGRLGELGQTAGEVVVDVGQEDVGTSAGSCPRPRISRTAGPSASNAGRTRWHDLPSASGCLTASTPNPVSTSTRPDDSVSISRQVMDHTAGNRAAVDVLDLKSCHVGNLVLCRGLSSSATSSMRRRRTRSDLSSGVKCPQPSINSSW